MKINDTLITAVVTKMDRLLSYKEMKIVIDNLQVNRLPSLKRLLDIQALVQVREEIEVYLLLLTYTITLSIDKIMDSDIKVYQDYRKMLISMSDWCKCALKTKIFPLKAE